jgi:hypothetical protein
MKRNCWEFNKCGREPGGEKADALGICPAAFETRLDDIHDGICAGRACWVVPDTLCNEHTQGTFEQKLKHCGTCYFYEYVKRHEGDGLVLTFALLEMINDDM